MKTKSVVEPRPIQRKVLNLEGVEVVAVSAEVLTIRLAGGTMW
jgi:hypothetical protein